MRVENYEEVFSRRKNLKSSSEEKEDDNSSQVLYVQPKVRERVRECVCVCVCVCVRERERGRCRVKKTSTSSLHSSSVFGCSQHEPGNQSDLPPHPLQLLPAEPVRQQNQALLPENRVDVADVVNAAILPTVSESLT